MSSNDDQGEKEKQTTHSQFWPMTICIVGIILLFLAFGECYSHWSPDGDNNPESNYTTQFCYSGLFLIFLATILSVSIDRKKEKAKKEKMTEEEKELEAKKKEKQDRENGIALLLLMLIVVFGLSTTYGGL